MCCSKAFRNTETTWRGRPVWCRACTSRISRKSGRSQSQLISPRLASANERARDTARRRPTKRLTKPSKGPNGRSPQGPCSRSQDPEMLVSYLRDATRLLPAGCDKASRPRKLGSFRKKRRWFLPLRLCRLPKAYTGSATVFVDEFDAGGLDLQDSRLSALVPVRTDGPSHADTRGSSAPVIPLLCSFFQGKGLLDFRYSL
jgi:hypothetical protein